MDVTLGIYPEHRGMMVLSQDGYLQPNVAARSGCNQAGGNAFSRRRDSKPGNPQGDHEKNSTKRETVS